MFIAFVLAMIALILFLGFALYHSDRHCPSCGHTLGDESNYCRLCAVYWREEEL
jgi:predicted amidophosphoribosyltransferase